MNLYQFHRMGRKFLLLIGVVLTVLVSGGGSAAAAGVEAGMFREGSVRASLLFGSGTAFGETYSVIGAGVGYYVVANVELGLDAESWQGAQHRISRVSPQVTYVVPFGEGFRPYAGIFYRRTFISGYEDVSDAGGRAGALFLYGRKAYLGAGIVYERHLGCERAVYDRCAESYPELIVAIMF
jgi:hypothetical protein